MVYDQGLVQRVREAMSELPGYVEKKMFGGIGFMLEGNMACGVIGDGLIVRVGKEKYENALSRPHVDVFDISGRSMTGWVVVKPEGYQADQDLKAWVEQGVDYASSLPAK